MRTWPTSSLISTTSLISLSSIIRSKRTTLSLLITTSTIKMTKTSKRMISSRIRSRMLSTTILSTIFWKALIPRSNRMIFKAIMRTTMIVRMKVCINRSSILKGRARKITILAKICHPPFLLTITSRTRKQIWM